MSCHVMSWDTHGNKENQKNNHKRMETKTKTQRQAQTQRRRCTSSPLSVRKVAMRCDAIQCACNSSPKQNTHVSIHSFISVISCHIMSGHVISPHTFVQLTVQKHQVHEPINTNEHVVYYYIMWLWIWYYKYHVYSTFQHSIHTIWYILFLSCHVLLLSCVVVVMWLYVCLMCCCFFLTSNHGCFSNNCINFCPTVPDDNNKHIYDVFLF